MSEETAYHPRIKISWLVGTLAAFSIFGIFGVYSKRMTETYPDFDQGRAQQRYATLAKVQQDEGKLLNPVDDKGNPTAVWLDQSKGTVNLPIEEAMAREIDDLKAQPPSICAETSEPMVPPPAPLAPPPGTTNAAPVNPAAPASTNAPPAKPSAPAAKPKP